MPKRFFFSLNTYIISLIVFFLLVILLFASLTYTKTSQTMDLYIDRIGTSAVTLAGRLIDQTLSSIDQYVFDFLSSNASVETLKHPQSDALSRYEAKLQLSQELSRIGLLYAPEGMLLYTMASQNPETMVYSVRSNLFLQNQSVADSLLAFLSSSGNPEALSQTDWFLLEVEKESFLAHTFLLDRTFFAVWFKAESLIGIFSDAISLSEDFNGEYLLLSKSNAAANMNSRLPEHKMMQYTSKVGDFSICLMANLNRFYSKRLHSLVLIIIIILLLVLIAVFINHQILIPLKSFRHAMYKIGSGDFSVRMESGTHILDLHKTYSVFNQLIDNIEKLKMETYEKQLQKQHIEQQFLHIQLRNHFFLNCLNIIYSLSQVGDCELIQKMVMNLTGYFRHLSSDAMQPISLESEIEHVQNYMSIQQLRFPGRIVYTCKMDPRLESFSIPPLIILTFVENCIIHIQRPKSFVIHIDMLLTSTLVAEQEGLYIRIEDNGDGFTEEQLALFNSEDLPLQFDHTQGLGINNIRNRLSLLYGQRAKLIISNKTSGHGAMIEMYLPAWIQTVNLHLEKDGDYVQHSPGR